MIDTRWSMKPEPVRVVAMSIRVLFQYGECGYSMDRIPISSAL